MTIEAVIFDIGNVLVEWHPERMFDAVIGRERRVALFADVDLAAMNDRVDLGEEISEVVPELARAHPEYHDDIMLWHSNWLDMLKPDIPLSAVLLRALRAKGVAVHALSNFGTSTLALAEQHFPVLKEFDSRYVSGHLRMMKPDPAIYAAVEQGTRVAPAGLFFIDDRSENIAAAKARGWQTHLFETPEGLAERLVAEGLLTRPEIAA
ncbi:MAG: HAD family phosphatase [Rhodobacter sp.]|nr:HAD family phosphatase [Rhodobacter sp.]